MEALQTGLDLEFQFIIEQMKFKKAKKVCLKFFIKSIAFTIYIFNDFGKRFLHHWFK